MADAAICLFATNEVLAMRNELDVIDRSIFDIVQGVNNDAEWRVFDRRREVLS